MSFRMGPFPSPQYTHPSKKNLCRPPTGILVNHIPQRMSVFPVSISDPRPFEAHAGRESLYWNLYASTFVYDSQKTSYALYVKCGSLDYSAIFYFKRQVVLSGSS